MFERLANFEHGVLKIAVLVGIAVVLCIILLQLMCRTPAESDAIIGSSPALQKHDRFCMDLPRPTDFRLSYRSIGGNSFTTAISYDYISNLSYAEVRDFFITNLTGSGWIKTGQYDEDMTAIPKEVSFSKDSYRVTITHVSARGADSPGEYDLYCAKELR